MERAQLVVDGTDRLTLRLQPGSRERLVFHRGSKPSARDGCTFEDPSGLLEWAAADRGVITFSSAQDVEEEAEELSRLVERWAAVPVEPRRHAVTDAEHPEGEST